MLGDSNGSKRYDAMKNLENHLNIETGCKIKDAPETLSSKLLGYMQPILRQQPQLHLHGNDGDGDGDLEALATLSQNKLNISSPSCSDPVLLIPTHHQLVNIQEPDSNFSSLTTKPFALCAPNPSTTCIPYAIFSATDASSCWSSQFQHFRHSHPELSASYGQQHDVQDKGSIVHTQSNEEPALCDGNTPQQTLNETTRWSQESLGDGQNSKIDDNRQGKNLSDDYILPTRHHSIVFTKASLLGADRFYQPHQFLEDSPNQLSQQFFNSQLQINSQAPQPHNKINFLDQGSPNLLTSAFPSLTASKVLLRFQAQQPPPTFIIQDQVLASCHLNPFLTSSASSLFPNPNISHAQAITTPEILPYSTTYENCLNPSNSPQPEHLLLYSGLSNLQAEATRFSPTSAAESSMVAEFFPTIYVSPLGIIEVLLRNHVVVEMTLDRAIRIVNKLHKAVVATSCRGNASCIYHTAAKIYQDHTTFEVLAYGNRQARARTEYIVFGGSFSNMAAGYCVTSGGHMSLVAKPNFSDISKDMSRTLLFSSKRYGSDLVPECVQTVEAARYRLQRNGSTTISINSVRIHQTATCDVIVTSERKNLRVSPVTGLARVTTHFVDMTVEPDWTIRVKRGGHKLHASLSSFILANDLVEFGFDLQQRLFIQPIKIHKETIIFQGKSLGDKNPADIIGIKGGVTSQGHFSSEEVNGSEDGKNCPMSFNSLCEQSEREIKSQDTKTKISEKAWKDTIEIS